MEKRRGLRCQICTGCGLCPGITGTDPAEGGAGELHILAEDARIEEKGVLGGKGVRLVTADIGTTTIAMLLYREDGAVADRYVAVNPQVVYGADVLSRIRAAENRECAGEMQEQVRGVLEKGIRRFAKSLAEGEKLYIVLAANTTMTYLLMGWDVKELGYAPFAATHLAAVETRIGGIPCFVFPGCSAFVGGDITAGIYASGMARQKEKVLLIDLGTNGEMALGNCERRIACATAAGPAFEGGANRGVWGADMVSLLARLLQERILDETGLLAEDFFERGVRIGNVLVTQRSVRSIQLAKAAIAAGIEILLERYGISAEQIDKVVLAGGFGYYLKPGAAAAIGLLPRALVPKTVAGGNTALAGALRAGRELFAGSPERALAARLEEVAGGTEVLNLALDPEFENRYVRAMHF